MVRKSDRKFLQYLSAWWKPGLLILLILVLLVAGLFWLSAGILLLVGSYQLLKYACNRIRNPLLKRVSRAALLFLYVFLVSMGLNLFVVELYVVPSKSMENTLLPKDVIVVNKLSYGTTVPQHFFEISWMNYLFGRKKWEHEITESRPPLRTSGLGHIRQGDVFVFKLPKIGFVVKRCVATAGQQITIKNGEIFTGNQPYVPSLAKYPFTLSTENDGDYNMLLMTLKKDYRPATLMVRERAVTGSFTLEQIDQLKQLQGVQVQRLIDTVSGEGKLFAAPPNTRWTADNLGPILVPQKGMTIALTPATVALYRKIMTDYERVTITGMENRYYVAGQPATTYTFKLNYYFAMGDYRKESFDSRYLGFIPEEIVIGKAQLVLYSNYQKKFRWGRMFRKIH